MEQKMIHFKESTALFLTMTLHNDHELQTGKNNKKHNKSTIKVGNIALALYIKSTEVI